MKPEELKNKMKEISNRSGYIDGIYNYCDRWCERCQYTSKCRNYAFSQETDANTDINNEEFWGGLSNIFQATVMLIKEDMEKRGIDIDDFEDVEVKEISNPKEHPLHILSYDLALEIHKWFEQNAELLKKKSKINNIIDKDLNIKFVDAVEVIQWYNFFISAKIYRSLPHYEIEIEDADFQSDSDGSAKIAILSIERSIASWGVLYEIIPEQEDIILSFLSKLSRLLEMTKKQFPQAMSFHRPGFDD